MSDQVIFTKEEVAIIRATVELTRDLDTLVASTLGKASPNVNTISKVLALLDSPRPRPKVTLGIVYGLLNLPHADTVDALEKSAIRYVNLCGFDVED